MQEYYLRNIKLLLEAKEYEKYFDDLLERARLVGIETNILGDVGKEYSGQGTLYITDSPIVLQMLIDKGCPVLLYYHEGNRHKIFSMARYAMEDPYDLSVDYLERVYRRCVGLPWEILETKRCLLRESRIEDREAFKRIYMEPSSTRYMEDANKDCVWDKDYLQSYIKQAYSYFEFGIWTIVLKDTKEVIGRAGISMKDGWEEPWLGYVIGKPWQRQGLACEVCREILGYVKEEYEFKTIYACIHEENEASIGLATKLGFEYLPRNVDKSKEYKIFVRNA